MQLDDMILVSVDDHVCEPPDLFEHAVPAKWKERAPRLLEKTDGSHVWYFDGAQVPNVGLNAVAGRPPDEYGMEPTSLSQLRRGCYDVDARIDDMNANGVLGSLCFASMCGFTGELFAKCDDRELGHVMAMAYNDWHVEAWCGAHPGRFIPLALPMLWDPQKTADEIRRMAKKGCHAVTFPDTPTVAWDTPRSTTRTGIRSGRPATRKERSSASTSGSGTGMNLQDPSAPVEIMITGAPVTLFNCANEIVFSKFIQKYPNLKIALSEGGTGWIPYFLERADYVYKHHHRWTQNDFGGKLPSDVFREHIVTCFIDDAVGVRTRDLIGIDNITWECDYPHSDATWPNSPETLWRTLDGVPGRGHRPDDAPERDEALPLRPVRASRPRGLHRGCLAREGCARRHEPALGRRRQDPVGLRERLLHDRRHHETDGRRVRDRVRGGPGHRPGPGPARARREDGEAEPGLDSSGDR